ncbi:MAG: hypothetical protein WC516_07880 [Patescibacteria group bacterium]|jgi:hypothetical protein
MDKSYIFVRDKQFDGSIGIKKIYLSNPNKVYMMVGEQIIYNGQKVEVIDVVFYERGYIGIVTRGVKCVILNENKMSRSIYEE